MNVLEVNDEHQSTNPGVTVALNSMIDSIANLTDLGARFHLACLGEAEWCPSTPVQIHEFKKDCSRLGRHWRRSPGLTGNLKNLARAESIDLVHIHGLWSHPQYAAATAAREMGLPSILTNHGILTKWALAGPGAFGSLKKKTYLEFVARRAFRSITTFHAITLEDQDDIARAFPGSQIALIPNSINVDEIDKLLEKESEPPSDSYFLFVGRLHPKKGVDILLRAFERANLPRHWRLLIIGPEDQESEYVASLKYTAESGGKAGQIKFCGPVWTTPEKLAYMRHAQALIVPSFSEAIGLINLEASACQTPTVTTPQTGLLDWQDGGGLLIQPDVGELTLALEAAAGWGVNERKERGQASRRLIEERYSTTATSRQWADLYTSLVA